MVKSKLLTVKPDKISTNDFLSVELVQRDFLSFIVKRLPLALTSVSCFSTSAVIIMLLRTSAGHRGF